MIVVAVTFGDEGSANKMARLLLEKRLIACANIFPIQSLYWWEGKVVEEGEFYFMVKTDDSKYEGIKKIVKENHSYDVPLIESWNIDNINHSYERWLKEEVKSEDLKTK